MLVAMASYRIKIAAIPKQSVKILPGPNEVIPKFSISILQCSLRRCPTDLIT